MAHVKHIFSKRLEAPKFLKFVGFFCPGFEKFKKDYLLLSYYPKPNQGLDMTKKWVKMSPMSNAYTDGGFLSRNFYLKRPNLISMGYFSE